MLDRRAAPPRSSGRQSSGRWRASARYGEPDRRSLRPRPAPGDRRNASSSTAASSTSSGQPIPTAGAPRSASADQGAPSDHGPGACRAVSSRLPPLSRQVLNRCSTSPRQHARRRRPPSSAFAAIEHLRKPGFVECGPGTRPARRARTKMGKMRLAAALGAVQHQDRRAPSGPPVDPAQGRGVGLRTQKIGTAKSRVFGKGRKPAAPCRDRAVQTAAPADRSPGGCTRRGLHHACSERARMRAQRTRYDSPDSTVVAITARLSTRRTPGVGAETQPRENKSDQCDLETRCLSC